MKEFVIGRDSSAADIHLQDNTVSSSHAKLIFSGDDRIIIQDSDSMNHTFVKNGSGDWDRIDRAEISVSATLRFGLFEIKTVQLLLKLIENNPSAKPIISKYLPRVSRQVLQQYFPPDDGPAPTPPQNDRKNVKIRFDPNTGELIYGS